jgi:hypothetical protein
MKCSECGADITGEEKFCSNCGAAVPNGGEAAAPETPEAAQPDPEPILNDAPMEEIEAAEQDEEPDAEPLLVEAEAPAASLPQGFEPAADAPPVVKASGKRNTGLIIAIVVLVILLLCCCCAIGVIAANFEEISLILEEMLEATY